MTPNILDFLVGFFLMNAMPHLLVGLFNNRFLSLFGYSSRANIAYAAFDVVVAFIPLSPRPRSSDV